MLRRGLKLPKNVEALVSELGRKPESWPRNCLINYPKSFNHDIDLIAQALKIVSIRPNDARSLVLSIDADAMKRRFIDVALWAGSWRASYSGVGDSSRKSSRLRKPISQKRLDQLFVRDKWRCRYCGIRVAGNRKYFKKFAAAIDMPELVSGRTDESRHGIYMTLMASYDHVKAHSDNGADQEDNLVTSCWSCQFGKYKYRLDQLQLDQPQKVDTGKLDDWQGLVIK